MDNVWKWLGFGQKVKAEKLLEKNFVIDIDYKNLAFLPGKASSNNIDFSEGKILPQEKWGGQNIKKIMLTIKCFNGWNRLQDFWRT